MRTTVGTDSLAACMNLSVRRNKIRRVPGGAGITFGLPVRVKMTLPAVSEPGDELDGITELETTVDGSRQSCEPEVAPTSQRSSSVRTASSSSETERDSEQRPPTLEVRKEAFAHRQEKSSENATLESQSVFSSQTTDNQVCNQQRNSSMQEGSQSFTTNPCSATIKNISSQQEDGANSSRQQMLHQMPTPLHQIPTPQGQTPSSHSIMQFARPTVVAAQTPQDTIVVKGKTYQRLGTIGKGGSSKVSFQHHGCFAVVF